MSAKDEVPLDLSDDVEFATLLTRRIALKAIEQAGQRAEAERKVIDAALIVRLGNAAAAFGPQDLLVTAPEVTRREYTVPTMTYRFVQVRRQRGKRR